MIDIPLLETYNEYNHAIKLLDKIQYKLEKSEYEILLEKRLLVLIALYEATDHNMT